ncbi:MAG: sel1 repeat family protein [Firmicutes bacterium]|nr:sel1 repeat family protein [Bacillota bacterium]
MINFDEELEKAKGGDGIAAYVVAVCYHHGYHGVGIHYGKSFSWWKKGAKMKDNALCLFMLAFINRANRKKSKKFFDQSFSRIEKMAEQGNPFAQNLLGVYHSQGFMGNPINFAQAAEMYKKSALQGFVMAQSNIGCYYLEGKGVEIDVKKAVEWFDKAIANGCKNSMLERQKAIAILQNSSTNFSQNSPTQQSQLTKLKCSACGGTIEFQGNLKRGFCQFCDTAFIVN